MFFLTVLNWVYVLYIQMLLDLHADVQKNLLILVVVDTPQLGTIMDMTCFVQKEIPITYQIWDTVEIIVDMSCF